MSVNVLIKPVGPDCNQKCAYCFYLEKAAFFSDAKVHRMSDEVLEEMVKQVMRNSTPQATFAWQGGEPTLAGLPFFEKAVQYQQTHGFDGQIVGNALQTNALAINDKWAAFFAKYRFFLGVSLDGPAEIHDHYRRTPGKGSPTHARVMDAIKRLQDHQVEFNNLIVVNDLTVKDPKALYHYFRDQGLRHLQFIPILETHPKTGEVMPYSVSPEDYGRLLCEIFDEWIQEPANNRSFIRIFNDTLAVHVAASAPTCVFMKTCGQYVVVEHNGDIFSCDFYVGPEWRLGNLMDTPLPDLLKGTAQRKFGAAKNALPSECDACPHLRACWGGCPKNRIIQNETGNASNYFCKAYKMYFSHTEAAFKRMGNACLEHRRRAQPRTEAAGLQAHADRPGRNTPCPCKSGKKFKHCCGA